MIPVAHLRKAEARVARLREAAGPVHAAISPDDPAKMPPKRERREYIAALDLVLRDYERIIAQLKDDR